MKKIIVFVLFSILVASVLYYKEFEDYYEYGESDTFEIKVGEEFHIKLYENGSPGYSNCWLNEKNNSLLKKVKEEYSPGLYSRMKYEGSGGITKITFKGLKAGIDTLTIANCSYIENKDSDNLNSGINNKFIVKISK